MYKKIYVPLNNSEQMWKILCTSFTMSACLFILFLADCESAAQEPRQRTPALTDSSLFRGAVEGVVRLRGKAIPQSTRVENTTDPAICGKVQSLEDILVSPESRGIKNAIVALTNVPASKIPAHQPGLLTLDNRECKFVPHVSVLTVGSTIQATNSDSTLHNTHFYGALRGNIALVEPGLIATKIAYKPGFIIVKCDVHGWMQAFIRVDTHPFHTVTDVNGYYRITDIGEGTYNMEIWHEKFGVLQKTIRIKSQNMERIEVEYSPGNN
ncbi:MAG: hypothetical protein ACE5I1_19300 [bacterium]